MNDVEHRMTGAIAVLRTKLLALRTGRASASLLERLTVDAYGTSVLLTQVGNVNVPEPRMLTVNVWDRGMVKLVEKAIRDAGLGLNPQSDGGIIRVPVPPLSEERRQELVKIAGKYAEEARVSVRNVRRDTLTGLRKEKRSEDDLKALEGDVQHLTDTHIKRIDEVLAEKQKEIETI